MKNKNKGLRRTITKVICLLIAIMSVVLVVLSYRALYKTYIGFYFRKSLGVVEMLAKQVDGDKIAQYVETGQTDEDYDDLQKLFNNAKETSKELNYLYLMKPYDDYFVYVIEAQTSSDNIDNISHLGDEFEYGEVEKKYLLADIKAKQATQKVVYGADIGFGKSLSVWAPVFDSQGEVAAMVEADYVLTDVQDQINYYIMNVLLVLLLAEVIIAFIMLKLIDRKVVNPIQKLTDYVNSCQKGNFSEKKVEFKDNNEIKWLATAFYDQAERIEEYIEDIKRVTSEKERIGAELTVATQIQADMLPCIFPPFPSRKEFDIYANMTPAKEVGGDFYDYFFIDSDHLALVIADVSGKGVPAALFMVIAKTLLKNRMQLGSSPKEVLEAVNNQLCENNEAAMFVTAWIGSYEISTGILTAANAGHEFPAIRRADGSFELYKDKHGFVLAGMEDMEYEEYQILLQEGDTLFLYTDGVPEASDKDSQLWGTQRMLDALNKQDVTNLERMLVGMREEINGFVAGAPQFDDVTMLAMRIDKISGDSRPKKEMTLTAEMENLDRAQAYVRRELQACDVPMKVAMQIDIIVEEIFVNVVNYAYTPNTGEVSIECKLDPDMARCAQIIFTDSGKPFNPLEAVSTDVTLPAEERPIGGLGIYMVRKLSKKMEYRYENGQNILTIWKDISDN